MNLRFLGGVAEVGRLGMVLDGGGARLLFDYGISPSDPPKYPEPCPPVDHALLTHAHLDHSGMMPWVAREHGVPVLAAPVTQPVAEMLAHDSLKIARIEGYQHPYGKGEIHDLAGAWESVEPGSLRDLGGLAVTAHNAGHIPGSLMYHVTDGSESVMFTGDLNLVDTRLTTAAKPVACDTLVVEATYAGRQHEDRGAIEKDFLDAVEATVSRGGTVLVPAFAVGRTQEVLMVLADRGFDVWVDGMGKQVAKHMLANPRSLRSAKELSRAFEAATLVRNPHQRDRATDAEVIVSTSGMMEGGPAVHYLGKLAQDPANAIFFTGYQVPGSGGAAILADRRFPRDDGHWDVKCEVRKFDFSGHAGHDDLVAFARACAPETVVLMHSDNRAVLAADLEGFAKVVMPETGENVTTS